MLNRFGDLASTIKQLIHAEFRHCSHLMIIMIKASDINIATKRTKTAKLCKIHSKVYARI